MNEPTVNRYCTRNMEQYFIGVDVGTRSVRAALFSNEGELKKYHSHSVTVYNPAIDFYEQSSDEIWRAVCTVVKTVSEDVDNKEDICGIGFDATCSLVVLDENFQPITVNGDNVEGDDRQNIIMWMDHRAHEQAEAINATKHSVLKYVGNKVSLEMQMPKLLWLKQNLPNTWKRAKHFLDLSDFLTMKATGSTYRSNCSLVCKWNFVSNDSGQGWDDSFLKAIHLEDLIEDNYARIGNNVLLPGELNGNLTEASSEAMGLHPNTAVSASLIDAHAGYLAITATPTLDNEESVTSKLALICGTSTCHMCQSKDAMFVPGVWGPYHNAILPQLWLSEGGQSVTGALVDHIIQSHPAYKTCPIKDVYLWIENIINKMTDERDLASSCYLTADIHIYPDFHGNRSPLADSTMTGMMSGLKIDSSEENLALLYLATMQALAYGTRDILHQLTQCGHKIKSVFMCGGLSNSKLFIKTHANVLGLPIMIPKTEQAVLLGAAMLGAAASNYKGGLVGSATAMASSACTHQPDLKITKYHDNKYKVFKMMQRDQIKYRSTMGDNH